MLKIGSRIKYKDGIFQSDSSYCVFPGRADTSSKRNRTFEIKGSELSSTSFSIICFDKKPKTRIRYQNDVMYFYSKEYNVTAWDYVENLPIFFIIESPNYQKIWNKLII